MDPSYKEPVDMLCIVNPCNPTGDYFDVESLKEFIKANVNPNGVVLVGRFGGGMK